MPAQGKEGMVRCKQAARIDRVAPVCVLHFGPCFAFKSAAVPCGGPTGGLKVPSRNWWTQGVLSQLVDSRCPLATGGLKVSNWWTQGVQQVDSRCPTGGLKVPSRKRHRDISQDVQKHD